MGIGAAGCGTDRSPLFQLRIWASPDFVPKRPDLLQQIAEAATTMQLPHIKEIYGNAKQRHPPALFGCENSYCFLKILLTRDGFIIFK